MAFRIIYKICPIIVHIPSLLLFCNLSWNHICIFLSQYCSLSSAIEKFQLFIYHASRNVIHFLPGYSTTIFLMMNSKSLCTERSCVPIASFTFSSSSFLTHPSFSPEVWRAFTVTHMLEEWQRTA